MKKKVTAAAAIALFTLSGCSGKDAPEASGPAAGDLLVTTPAAAGELDAATWNLPFGEPASLDPIKAFNYPENTVVANLCEGLMKLESDYSISPNLATKVDTPDDKTYVYTIRDGVKFWDGQAMTVDDVAYSLNRHLDPKEGSYWADGAVSGNIESVKASGDHQVTVKLKKADASFNSYMVTPLGSVIEEKQRKEAGSDFGTPSEKVMCTGPFSVAGWDQGQSITLEKNANYWNTKKQAKTKSLKISFIVDPSAISNALTTGEIDGSYDVPLSAVSSLSGSTSGQLLYGKSLQLVGAIGTGEGPFNDPAVRRALYSGLDREAIAATVFEGTATASRSLVPNNGWSYGADIFGAAREKLPAGKPDLEAAKAEIAKAKIDTSEPIRIAYPSERTFYADIISEMSNVATELGLKIEPVGLPSAKYGAFFSDPAAREGYGAFMTTNYMDVPDPLAYLRTIVGKDGSQNYSGYDNPEINKLLDEAAVITDDAERATKVAQIESLAINDVPWIPVVDPAVRLYLNDRVTGVPASFVYLYYPWAADLGAAAK
ncbi:ABC transporter substrate-binding protein [Saxibacter everestensis]|uniref:ABC transporter substrate-binding protein n=1 Tax=Saxibacter everestensis TaxID=2909229 RepID=A0ABY8QR59_9MICO|nr:ABC transporter substrate-binding protein [Brevibacteriaceae bacterium ZFBP1038]